jgi:hypothetical protein
VLSFKKLAGYQSLLHMGWRALELLQEQVNIEFTTFKIELGRSPLLPPCFKLSAMQRFKLFKGD